MSNILLVAMNFLFRTFGAPQYLFNVIFFTKHNLCYASTMNYPLATVPLGVMQFHNSKESKLYMVKRWMEFSPIQNAYQTTQAELSKNAITIINSDKLQGENYFRFQSQGPLTFLFVFSTMSFL